MCILSQIVAALLRETPTFQAKWSNPVNFMTLRTKLVYFSVKPVYLGAKAVFFYGTFPETSTAVILLLHFLKMLFYMNGENLFLTKAD